MMYLHDDGPVEVAVHVALVVKGDVPEAEQVERVSDLLNEKCPGHSITRQQIERAVRESFADQVNITGQCPRCGCPFIGTATELWHSVAFKMRGRCPHKDELTHDDPASQLLSALFTQAVSADRAEARSRRQPQPQTEASRTASESGPAPSTN